MIRSFTHRNTSRSQRSGYRCECSSCLRQWEPFNVVKEIQAVIWLIRASFQSNYRLQNRRIFAQKTIDAASRWVGCTHRQLGSSR